MRPSLRKTKLGCFYIAIWSFVFIQPPLLLPQNLTALANFERDIRSLLDQVKPSVVTVSARMSYSYLINSGSTVFGLRASKEEAQRVEYTNIGSGIIFNDQGLILTKSSIVLGASDIDVTFSDGRTKIAELLGHDCNTGLAIIKVDDSQLQPARLGDSDKLNPGAFITIVGNSLGVSHAVSFGLVNSVRDDGLIQLSAMVSPGNSGSPIFNVKGEVVGILAAIVSDTPWSPDFSLPPQGNENALAYPINQMRRLATDLVECGTKPKGWVGIIADDLPGRQGLVHISGVISTSPAEKAGLRVGDLIIGMNHQRFGNSLELVQKVKNSLPGDTITLDILRGNAKNLVHVIIGQSPETESSMKNPITSTVQTNQNLIMTNWQQFGINESSHLDPEFIMARIRYLEQEIEMLKTHIRAQK